MILNKKGIQRNKMKNQAKRGKLWLLSSSGQWQHRQSKGTDRKRRVKLLDFRANYWLHSQGINDAENHHWIFLSHFLKGFICYNVKNQKFLVGLLFCSNSKHLFNLELEGSWHIMDIAFFPTFLVRSFNLQYGRS